VFLTDSGRALQKELVPLAEEVNRISVEGISEASIGELRSTLLTMIENLVTAEAQAMLAETGTSDAV
jgi:DNA-binding MarR family transcriptional regulator